MAEHSMWMGEQRSRYAALQHRGAAGWGGKGGKWEMGKGQAKG